MTRRERLEHKLKKREEWAQKAGARADAQFDRVKAIADQIPLGQPILVGHHSERHARRDVARIHSGMSNGVAEAKLADHHKAKASGIAIQLKSSVFSDDPDAIEALKARITENEAKAEKWIAINKAWRKGGEKAVAELTSPAIAKTAAETMARCPWLKGPLDAAGLRASIRKDKERIEEIKVRQARAATAEASPSGVVIEELFGSGNEGYSRVTFAEKPAREILDALRAAGFFWGRGSWTGKTAQLPQCVVDLTI